MIEGIADGELLPGAVFNVVGAVEIGLVGGVAGVGEVEFFVVFAITQAGGPGALAVVVAAAAHGQLVIVVQDVVDVADHLPVDQVVGLHDGHARAEVHGGAGHVVGVAHADDVGVGGVGIDAGVVVEGAVAVVAGGAPVGPFVGGKAHRAKAAQAKHQRQQCGAQAGQGVFHNALLFSCG